MNDPEPAADPMAGAKSLSPQAMVEGEQAAYRHFMEGLHASQNDDNEVAITAYRNGLAALPDEVPYGKSRGSLALRLALSYAAAYNETGDLEWLDAQRDMLVAYKKRLPEILPGNPDAQRERRTAVDLRLAAIERERERVAGDHGNWEEQLARSLRDEYKVAEDEPWSPTNEDLRWYPRPDDPRPRTKQQSEQETAPEHLVPPEQMAQRRKGVGLVVGGSIALAAGVAGLGVMGAGMARANAANSFSPLDPPDERLAQIQRGKNANTMAVVGAVSGGVLLVTGAVLVGLGAKRMRANPRAAAFAPVVGPHGIGVSF